VSFSTSGCGERETETPAAQRRPHVVLLVVDTLRADALGTLGSGYPTPNLDRLAKEGVVFTTAIAPSTWTLPSVASLITSLHPSEHGLLGAGEEGSAADGGAAHGAAQMPQQLDDDLMTIADAFHAGGYRTAGIVNQVYLRYKFGFGQGYDHYEQMRGQSGFRINRKAAEWLDQEKAAEAAAAPSGESRPLFLYLHYLDPHWPYDYRVKGPVPEGLAAADDDPGLPRSPDILARWMAEQRDAELKQRGIATLSARYALEVLHVDSAIGHLIEVLSARGLWDDTLLVVTSDHGEGFWEHERLLHGHAPYDEQIRVPLVLRFPAWMDIAPARLSAPVGLIDVMPTLLDLAGIPVPAECRGRSLAPVLQGRETEDVERAILIETGNERAVRTRDAKVLVSRAGETPVLEYYDLAADPSERTNLASPCEGPCREDVRRMRDLERGLVSRGAAAGGVTPEEIEELKALGYLGD
jgi:arylsulfatase A-like enzyme